MCSTDHESNSSKLGALPYYGQIELLDPKMLTLYHVYTPSDKGRNVLSTGSALNL